MQADVPTFTFVDLPGIQTYPEEQEKATSDLVNTYLSRPSTLVLCVVDATTAAFDTSVALKLIRRAGKLSNTIVAMTKSDLVTEEDEYVPKIFDRILGESSDSEHLRKLAGCVAVANRQQRSNVSLADADAAERKVFSRTLHNPAEAFAPPAVQQQLQESMTITQLIVQLDRMFHSYIVQHWKPAALEKLGVLISTSQEHLQQLGPPVEELTADGKMAVVWSKVRVNVVDAEQTAHPCTREIFKHQGYMLRFIHATQCLHALAVGSLVLVCINS